MKEIRGRKKKSHLPPIEEQESELQETSPQELWNQEERSETIEVLEKVNQPQIQ